MMPRALLVLAALAPAVEKDDRLYELRIHHAVPGKLGALSAHARDQGLKLLEKHGITSIGYWVPVPNPDHRLIAILAYPGRAERDRAWQALHADPDWQKGRREAEARGKLLEKVESRFLTATDYSPPLPPSPGRERVFVSVVLNASPGRFEQLNTLIRDHGLKLLEKHGLTNVGYWRPAKGEKGADDTLIVLLAHDSAGAVKSALDAFQKDPAWLAARKDAEEKGAGPLLEVDGIKTLTLNPTSYSPLK